MNETEVITPITGIPAQAVPLALAEFMQESGKAAIFIAVSDREMQALARVLPFFASDYEILTLPAWETVPYDRASPRAEIMAARVETLAKLAVENKTKRILLTTVNSSLQKLPPKSAMRGAMRKITTGEKLNREDLVAFLTSQGYRRVGKAMETGEFALRGSLIDIIPSGAGGEGVRIDLFGDEVESIRSFEPLSQLSEAVKDHITFLPVNEIVMTEANTERFRNGYREAFGAISKEDTLYEALSNGQHYPGMEHFLPLFYDKLETLADYMPGAAWVFAHQAQQVANERHDTILDYYQARQQNEKQTRYHPLPPDRLSLMPASWELLLEGQKAYALSPFAMENAPAKKDSYQAAPNLALKPSIETTPYDLLREHIQAVRTLGKATLLAAQSEGSAERLSGILAHKGFHVQRVNAWNEAKKVSGKTLGLTVLPIEQGFQGSKVSIISEIDLLGERTIRAVKKRKQSDVFLQEAANFEPGELVVHKEHGIGRFDGLITLEVADAKHDCLKLIYDDEAKLFLPVENIELISRYGEETEGVRLDKLGSASWQARKARMKERIKIAAAALMKIAAERALKEGEIISPQTGLYDAFVERFPYMETEDQQRAIDEVIDDLQSGKPMDRLVCGDVGFGKTEVALRAAFAVASTDDGSRMTDDSNPSSATQVALICPTTLLARQHFKNFKERFAGFGIEVRQLSRMVPAREQKETKEMLADGRCQVVVGTHALLAKSLQFKKLGLLIIDEEQHFGVGQKEKLKELKADVHVLTLSATPIPRTLQMALSGVRSLSLITTPPVDRLATRSFVTPFDPVVLREALLREKHRGGRSFIVCPRIKDIPEIKAKIAALVPELKLIVAHGQMTPGDLDTIMNEFYDGTHDVLISTAIIESGLDIPTANTMIIHHAHRFGLSQLYQLRGRVGRGKIRAYAYFLLPERKVLGLNAARRLEVMQSLDSLGAGFQLASHDMDIRGSGNLIGEEQSGHVREVGVELYQQMLEEAITALKRDNGLRKTDDSEPESSSVIGHPSSDQDWSPQINLGLSVLIPETYIEDLSLRLGLYRRVALLESEQAVDAFAAELIDRFGNFPEEVQHLLEVVTLKNICKKACIERLDAGPKGAVITLRHNAFPKPDALLTHIEKSRAALKLRPDQKLFYAYEWKNDTEKLKLCHQLAQGIAGLL